MRVAVLVVEGFAVVALAPPSSSGTLLQQIADKLLVNGCFSFNPKL